MKTSAEIRQAFLEYFAARDHQIVPSSSLVPANDPTLLFTNAGMVQFKDVFLGTDELSYKRAASSQRCVRAGGKHNDLENVGYTARHHTFFEMLGNFSFGDYFKRAAIHYAWEFLTETLQLPTERLWMTVYQDDDEAADVWLKEIGIDPERFSRIGDHPAGKRYDSDNFWSMGEVGPCGPCSEIFYDHGEDVPGGPPGSPDADADRYIEIWNLVFMQFNRDASGELTPLPKPAVDTGMGLERLAAVLQGVHSNYEIDLFRYLITAAAKATKTHDLDNKSLRVIADHIRSAAFLISDGVLPSNEGRGYVLRRIIRRAIRHGYQLGQTRPFFYLLIEALKRKMGDAYPELGTRQMEIERVLRNEEERFAETLEQGMEILEAEMQDLRGATIPGETLFRLYDTYGFPVDLTADIARERGLQIDLDGFEKRMHHQRQRARAASDFGVQQTNQWRSNQPSKFSGYEGLVDQGTVLALYRNGESVKEIDAEELAVVILDRTPFYAESGGQVGDQGELTGEDVRFSVTDTQQQTGSIIGHLGVLEQGHVKLGDILNANVDAQKRHATESNHSATHLLHAALRQLLGTHVQQKGSLVNSDRLRFDFAHFEPLNDEQLAAIERLVNRQIRLNAKADVSLMSLADAQATGAIALFGEKYDEQVRVLRLGDFSIELCGGTHVSAAGDIGLFRIVSESGVAAGIRRIEALTGEAAIAWTENEHTHLGEIAGLLNTSKDKISSRISQLLQRNRKLEKELDKLRNRLTNQTGDDLLSTVREISGVNVLAASLQDADAKSLRGMLDKLKDKLGSGVILLMTSNDKGVHLIAGVTHDLTDRLHAGDLVQVAAEKVGGKGGGRPDMAQAGGNKPDSIPEALAVVEHWVRERAT